MSSGIHSFLIGITEGAPNTIVDNALDNGFEAWRRLVREYDPQSSEHNFGRMQTVMRQPRVKSLKDFTARVESWEREVRTLVDRTKQPIPDWMLTNIMIEMLPVEHEAHLRNYMVKPDSTYLVVRQAIVDQVQRITGAPSSMDTSLLERAVANLENVGR